VLQLTARRCNELTAVVAAGSFRQLPAAQTISASMLAALIEQALQQGRTLLARELARFLGLEQISAGCLQQLLQLLAMQEDRSSRDLEEHLLQLPGAQTMVSQQAMHRVHTAGSGLHANTR
jgi:hypothetical protein